MNESTEEMIYSVARILTSVDFISSVQYMFHFIYHFVQHRHYNAQARDVFEPRKEIRSESLLLDFVPET